MSNATHGLAEIMAPSHGADASAKCTEILVRLRAVGGSLKPSGCETLIPGAFCCDSWMMEFVRQVKAGFGDEPIPIQMWKWTVRPNKTIHGFAHHAGIFHKSAGMVGLDTHYFTVANYCPDQYWVFDTIHKRGRDVSRDFVGEVKSRTLLTKDFTFKFAAKVDKGPQICKYDSCVIECVSDWLQGDGIKQANVPPCLTGIIL